MDDRRLGVFGQRMMVNRVAVPTPTVSSTLKPAAAAVPKPAPAATTEKPTGRHAAIRKLPTLATYRSWSAKVRTDWDDKK